MSVAADFCACGTTDPALPGVERENDPPQVIVPDLLELRQAQERPAAPTAPAPLDPLSADPASALARPDAPRRAAPSAWPDASFAATSRPRPPTHAELRRILATSRRTTREGLEGARVAAVPPCPLRPREAAPQAQAQAPAALRACSLGLPPQPPIDRARGGR